MFFSLQMKKLKALGNNEKCIVTCKIFMEFVMNRVTLLEYLPKHVPNLLKINCCYKFLFIVGINRCKKLKNVKYVLYVSSFPTTLRFKNIKWPKF